MRVLIFGAGALGSLLGFHLSRGADVVLVGRGEHLKALQKWGLTVVRREGEEVIRLPVYESPPEEKFNLILLTVKSYQTSEALPSLGPLLKKGTPLLSLQNGLNNEREVVEYCERRGIEPEVLGGTTSIGATFIEPGLVREGGLGETVVGIYRGGLEAERVGREFIQSLQSVGLKARWSDNIKRELWKKSIVNSAINTLTALLGVKNGYLLRSGVLRETMRRVAEEGVMCAREEGIEISEEEVYGEIISVIRGTSENLSSTLQDIKRGRRTEVDSFLGEIIRVGEGGGVNVKTLKTLYYLTLALQRARSGEG